LDGREPRLHAGSGRQQLVAALDAYKALYQGRENDFEGFWAELAPWL
jgi:hypothetical protein